MSARVSKGVLRASRGADISGYTHKIPDDRVASCPLRGQHDSHEGGPSISEKLHVAEKSYIKFCVATLNRTFRAMHPLEVYYLNQSGRSLTTPGIGSAISAPLYVRRGQGIGKFFGSLIRLVHARLWSGAKAVVPDTLRTGG